MAEIVAFRNNALPYPVYGVPWTLVFPLVDADGGLVTGATCDSEISKNGDTAVDCTNEGVEIPFTTATNKGMYYLTLTAAEMSADIVAVTVYSATSKARPIVLHPKKLVTLASGTSQGGDTAYITVADGEVTLNNQYTGCLCVASIDGAAEARVLGQCDAADQKCYPLIDWNVAPDADDTYTIYLPEGMQIPQANVTAISHDATAADNLELDYDGTGYAKANSTIGTTTANTDMLTAAAVNAEVLDVLATDEFAQPGQEAPAATQTLAKMLAFLYKKLRNKQDAGGGIEQIYADDETTVDQKRSLAEAAGTFTLGELETGP